MSGRPHIEITESVESLREIPGGVTKRLRI